ncbi:MAG: hypothetical protein NTY19_19545 [Planctomycetota bacterium]|nr:hypothetical protein [Planctomycetota bacterium]
MCGRPELDFVAVERRLDELVAWVSSELEAPQGCCGELDELRAIAARLEGEENLFYILLVTHFASPRTAHEFYARLDWAGLLQSDTSTVRTVSTDFFQEGHLIGDHRRYFRCLTTSGKIEYTLEVLEAYTEVMQTYGSQGRFFETDGHPAFEMLYERMREIRHFERRLPRFDHLEALARTHGFYFVPTRFFADEDEGGPRDGLTYLLLGLRLRHTKGLSAYLRTAFPDEWNAAAEAKYHIPRGSNLHDVMRKLEIWTIDHVRPRLPSAQQPAPAYIFALESCLCNWQKGK